MPNFRNSKIYIIKSKNTNDEYIGSTTKKTINDRYSQHKWAFKQFIKGIPTECNYTSRKVLEKGDCWVELIENYPCDSKYQLKQRENHYIINNNNAINKIKYIENDNMTEEEKEQQYINKTEKMKKNKIFSNCECGGKYQDTQTDIKRHCNTNKHIYYFAIKELQHKDDD